MEILSSPFKNISPKKRQHGMRSKYHQVDGKCHKKNNMQTIKFGSDSNNNNKKRSCWKIKKVPKLRLGSPSKLWGKIKNAYISLARGNNNHPRGGRNINAAEKRTPKARKVHPTYTQQEFQDRLIFEIYKNMVASRELASE